MSKTNHRINKDRGEKYGEAEAHKQRRGTKQKVSLLVDSYAEFDDPDDIYDLLAEDTFEPFEKRSKRRK